MGWWCINFISIKINAITDEMINTDTAIFNSKEYAIVTPSKAECESVSPK